MAKKVKVSVDSMAESGIQLKAPEETSCGMNIVLTDEEISRIREGIGEFLRDLYFLRIRNPLLVDVLLGWVFESGNVTKIAASLRTDRRNVQRILDALRGPDTPETLRRVVGLPPL